MLGFKESLRERANSVDESLAKNRCLPLLFIDVSSIVGLNYVLQPVSQSMLHMKVVFSFNYILNIILLFSLIR